MQNDFRLWLSLIEAVLDPTERLSRAKQMGFDTSRVWYHSSKGHDIEAFDPALLGRNTGAKSATKGFFFTSDPKVAVSYGGSERFMLDSSKPIYDKYAADIVALKAEMESALSIWNARGQEEAVWYARFYDGPKKKRISPEAYRAARDAIDAKYDTEESRIANARYQELHKQVRELEQRMKNLETSGHISKAVVFPVFLKLVKPLIFDMHGDTYREVSYNDLLVSAKRGRRDGAIIKNTFDPGYRGAEAPMCDIAVAFRPQQVRSVHASFDPDRPDSPNIMD